MKGFVVAALGAATFGITSAAPAAWAAKIYGIAEVAGAQRLVTWDSANPSVLLSDVPITNLPAGETIRGMDFSAISFPGATPRLYGIGAGVDQYANVYQIFDQAAAAIALKLPYLGDPIAIASGEHYGVTSFGSDALRSVNDAGRLTGYSTVTNSGSGDGAVAYAIGDHNEGRTPHAVHLFNRFAVDTAIDVLGRISLIGSPRPITTIGSLGADFDDAGAIDAARGDNNETIYAALLPAGQTQSNFYVLDQQTGQANLIGRIGNGVLISAMAVTPLPPIPEPAPLWLIATGLAAWMLSGGPWESRR
ncbi:MAG: hypothetical protein DCC67_04585 [Planctomycetota bacterium]|nr:MAG: hypothetical protein DCC67_04585 [Planctomycetota bacterium]